MKKNIIIISIIIILTSCKNIYDEPNVVTHENSSSLSNNLYTTISIDEAIELANNARGEFYTDESRSETIYDISSVKTVTNCTYCISSRSIVTDTLLYVINYAGESGSVIVSAVPSDKMILAVTDNGSIGNPAEITNPGIKIFMQNALAMVSEQLRPVPQRVRQNQITVRRTLVDENVAPRVSVSWGQYYPLGSFCPNNTCGCVTTAFIQAFSYLERPTYVQLTYPERDVNHITLNWSQLKTNTGDLSSLSYLGREFSHRIGAIYHPENPTDTATGTSAYIVNARNVSATLLNTYATVSSIISGVPNVHSLINQSGVICMSGVRNNEIGHVWLIDGYRYKKVEVSIYTVTYDNNGLEIDRALINQVIETTAYNHINWGWDGFNNGYFLKDVYDSSNAYTFDGPHINDTTKNYTSDYNYLVIKPL